MCSLWAKFSYIAMPYRDSLEGELFSFSAEHVEPSKSGANDLFGIWVFAFLWFMDRYFRAYGLTHQNSARIDLTVVFIPWISHIGIIVKVFSIA